MRLPEPLIQLKSTWGFAFDPSASIATANITVCHWSHALPELPKAVHPTNCLFVTTQRQTAHMLSAGRRTTISGGRHNIGLVVEGEEAAWEFDDPTDVFHIYIGNETLARAAVAEGWSDRGTELRQALSVEDPLVRQLAVELTQASTRGERDKLYADTLGLALSMRLLRTHAVEAPQKPSSGGLAPYQLRRVTQYLIAHLGEEMALAELATVASLSPYHFIRAFKQSTGLTPHAFLTQKRMERAQELMRAHPQMGLAEIALCVGYDSQPAFTTAFKRVVGATPGHWRREMAG